MKLGATMHEGWHGDEYLILFDESAVVAASDRYEFMRRSNGTANEEFLGDGDLFRLWSQQHYDVSTGLLNSGNGLNCDRVRK